jgi:hypothetical protein
VSIIIIDLGATKFFGVFVVEMTLGISNRSNNCDFFLAKTGYTFRLHSFALGLGVVTCPILVIGVLVG